MAEYGYKDIIIDPDDPRVEIGAKYYFALGAQACIDRANNDSRGTRLQAVDGSGEYHPFISGDEKDYPFIIRKKEPSYIERYCKWLADNGIKTGDEVRVTRKAANNEDGWDHSWAKEMDATVGKVLKIEAIGKDSVFLTDDDGEWWEYPYFVLEKVEQKYVPFDLSNEEDRAKLRGAWVKAKNDLDKHQNVCGVCSQFVYLSCQTEGCTPKDFLEKFVFIDGTPCGQEVEE